MRIDVDIADELLAAELSRLGARLRTRGDVLYGLPELPLRYRGLHFYYREADGDYYVYVCDGKARCVGYIVFNRLVEVGKLLDAYVRAPHSKLLPAYQGLGLGKVLYGWALQAGLCLLSGARQSPAAHRLWQSLARRYPLRYVALRHRQLHDLGRLIDSARLSQLSTRMLLLGEGWTMPRLQVLAQPEPLRKQR